tara:strand:+ start:192 stop:587 length:396 start_codon:yes stop_codon:yes gene_type:complete
MTKEYKELKELLIECDEMQTSITSTHEFHNTWIRRFFRLYLDGSYSNYEDYKNNCLTILNCNGNVKKLTSFVKNKFIDFIQIEFKMSRYSIEKTIKEAFKYSKDNKTNLELFNCHLIEDALELAKSSEMGA